MIELARSNGAEITRDPAETFYGGYAGVFRDPPERFIVLAAASLPEADAFGSQIHAVSTAAATAERTGVLKDPRRVERRICAPFHRRLSPAMPSSTTRVDCPSVREPPPKGARCPVGGSGPVRLR